MRSTTVTKVGAAVAVLVAIVFIGATVVAFDDSGTNTPSTAAGATKPADGAESQQRTYLMVFRAGSMSTSASGASTTVTLRDIDPTADWFTDRPERDSGTAPTERLLTSFFGPRAGSAPNVTIAGTAADGHSFLSVVELSSPHYDVAAGTATFVAQPLSDRAIAALPPAATSVAITVDTYAQSCLVSFKSTVPGGIAEGFARTTSGGQIFRAQIDAGNIATDTPVDSIIVGNDVAVTIQQSTADWAAGHGLVPAFFQEGGVATGCGGVAEIQFHATVQSDGTEPCFVEWSNPEIGSTTFRVMNSSGCTMTLDSSSTTNGDDPEWNFDVSPG